ncbi:O-methylsterigmatocystin oxidoreductase [Epithele typhae]|uniref:O-methylsterigmatocystin oxidoreductase n=1 Tax=Epithele typhae TaxID=378194 RepID=UPI002008AE4F|nr:O-methylsterigmatocystin oxidoreductase [Epithele typhae]KAH9912855.1 O-methylsterigmatocystin oxidoreductase [Epithele typhae]
MLPSLAELAPALAHLASHVDLATVLAAVFGSATALYIRRVLEWRARSRGRPLPPGPRGLPFVGNMFDMPKVRPWVGLREMCAQYGDIMHFSVMGQRTIVLNSPEAISEFLEKRAANTSDRLVTPMVRLTANEWVFGLMPYGQSWRDHRRAFWQHFNPNAISIYQPTQAFTFAATMLKIIYGIECDDEDNEIMRVVEESLQGTAQLFVPGKYLVDLIPALEYVPSWFPGAGWRETSIQSVEMPYAQRIPSAERSDEKSIVDSMIEKFGRRSDKSGVDKDVEAVIKQTCAVSLGAGTDTTFSTMQATFLAMSLYPNVMKAAQAELDAVVGPSRLPTFDDRDACVYVNAIIKESLRWFNVTPLGISHRTSADDEISGFFIPKGTVLISSIWSCMHDPEVYENPEEFRPERFIRDGRLDPDVRDPFDFAFGFGRRGHGGRICPGRYFADAALFLNIATVLHLFDIGVPLDDAGEPIPMEVRLSDSFAAYPEEFRCTVKPRSAEAVSLILAE